MPNRLGLLHVRPCGEKQTTDEEQVDKVVAKLNSHFKLVSYQNLLSVIFAHKVVAKLEDKTETFIKEREAADSAEAVKLGLKVEADEVEKFMSASMQERTAFYLLHSHLMLML